MALNVADIAQVLAGRGAGRYAGEPATQPRDLERTGGCAATR
jgi:hypothetical protein